ncbi:MAG: RnfABCDGE type electron transport complex subunit D [Clostridia bacterium]|nr:RnfABCDGE type electron transport complex subunit D [Clostridia bacterium]
MNRVVVSASPHLLGPATTRRIMLDVILALSPACVASVVIFGPLSAAILILSVAAAVGAEYLTRRIMKRDNTIGDFSAAVTGMLLAMNLPANLHALWMAPLGSIIAIVVIKQMFGGIGMNFANPAIAGRIVLTLSFTAYMTQWPVPLAWLGRSGVDAATFATPLAQGAEQPNLLSFLLGVRGGCLGETCAIALLAGGIYLVARRVITPLIPAVFIGTTVLLGWAFGEDPLQQLLSGGLLLGAIFMATDYATTPSTNRGRVIFAIGCGLFTAVIRRFGSLPEGVSFSILLMNIATPLIDRTIIRKPFGTRRKGAEK